MLRDVVISQLAAIHLSSDMQSTASMPDGQKALRRVEGAIGGLNRTLANVSLTRWHTGDLTTGWAGGISCLVTPA